MYNKHDCKQLTSLFYWVYFNECIHNYEIFRVFFYLSITINHTTIRLLSHHVSISIYFVLERYKFEILKKVCMFSKTVLLQNTIEILLSFLKKMI